MCGLAGFIGTASTWSSSAVDEVRRMASALAHRGPDDEGNWIDHGSHVALGHKRLSIVDLSPLGRQPMASACGRYVLAFNGEIYNHLELRRRIGSSDWRGHSDTETLLACLSRFGLAETIRAAVGMFAMAVWDSNDRSLTLVRDRMGEKPLYYAVLPNGEFLFASELKALCAHPRWQGAIDRDALALFMRYNCIPAPWTIYSRARKVRPGECLIRRFDGSVELSRYWSVEDVARQSLTARANALPDREAIDELEGMLSRAVAGQMLADVPLGAFLSGGVDSSAVVALMQKCSRCPVKTFSIGFNEFGFNEAEHARAVAQHLGTDHTELYVSASDALSVVPLIPAMFDEPFADSSQIPTFLVSRLARRHVTVALSGDGGDELFAGYSRYVLAERLWRTLDKVPATFRRWLSHQILRVRPAALDRWLSRILLLTAPSLKSAISGDKVHKFAANVLGAEDPAGMYRSLVSHWREPSDLVLQSTEPKTFLDEAAFAAPLNDVETMSLTDQLTYLPDDILVKVDRASMAVSLETRAPFLDHRLVEFAWRTPMRQKIRDGQSKWLLRQMLYRYVPRALIERPKQGFAVPLDAWLRGPLREWAEDLLNPSRLSDEGYLNSKLVRARWEEHQSGVRNWQYQLWDVLIFQGWLAAHGSRL